MVHKTKQPQTGIVMQIDKPKILDKVQVADNILAVNFELRTNKIIIIFLFQQIDKFIESTKIYLFLYKFRAEKKSESLLLCFTYGNGKLPD